MSRVVDILVGLAAGIAAVVLVVMLAAPLLPRPATGATLTAPSTSPVASATPQPEMPPIGLYLLRGPFSFGPCLAIRLSAESYPVDPAAEGGATVLWWERGMTGCDTRSGAVREVQASIGAVRSENEGALIGHAVRFGLPAGAGATVSVEITILAEGSTNELLQAIETSSPGAPGLVFDQVAGVDPPEDPLPSPSP